MRFHSFAREAALLLLPVAALCAVAWHLTGAPPRERDKPLAAPVPPVPFHFESKVERLKITPEDVALGTDAKLRLSVQSVGPMPGAPRNSGGWALRDDLQVWAVKDGHARPVADDGISFSFKGRRLPVLSPGPITWSLDKMAYTEATPTLRLQHLPASLGALELRYDVALVPLSSGLLNGTRAEVMARAKRSRASFIKTLRVPLRALGQSTAAPRASRDPGWEMRAAQVEPLGRGKFKVTLFTFVSGERRFTRWSLLDCQVVAPPLLGVPLLHDAQNWGHDGWSVVRAATRTPDIIFGKVEVSSFVLGRRHKGEPAYLLATLSLDHGWPRTVKVSLPLDAAPRKAAPQSPRVPGVPST